MGKNLAIAVLGQGVVTLIDNDQSEGLSQALQPCFALECLHTRHHDICTMLIALGFDDADIQRGALRHHG